MIPTLQAIVYHETVALYWDKTAENSIDPYTGYADFEGYRLYRSDDGGKTWGELWEKIYDYNGNQVGWKPIVQYDYSLHQDTSHCVYQNDFDDDDDICGDLVLDTTYTRGIDISEYDPEALWTNIGENTGIHRMYRDITIVDGKEYMYAVTAYDIGLRTYEVEFTYLSDELWQDKLADGGNENEVWDDAEIFTDNNNNEKWDSGEDFIDEERENGTWDLAACICQNDNTTSTATGLSEATCIVILCEGNIPAIWYDEETYTDSNGNGIKDGIEDHDDEKRYNGIWDDAEKYTDCNNNNQYDFDLNLHCADTSWSKSNPDSLLGPNGSGLPSFESPLLYESFTDYNVNGTWDDSEPFIDANDNGVWDKRNNPVNVVTIKPGYFASNVETFEHSGVKEDFTTPSLTNIGNGYISSEPVNEAEVIPSLIRFEVDACLDRNGYGDQNGSFATGCRIDPTHVDCAPGCLSVGSPPSLYAYEIKDTVSYEPKYTEDIYLLDSMDEDSIFFYKGLPGAKYDSDQKKITLPEYIISNFNLDYINHQNVDWASNWTDWFNGFQFRFDNGPYLIDDCINGKWAELFLIPSDFKDLNNNGYRNWYKDEDCDCWVAEESGLMDRMYIQMRYKTNLVEFYSRPNYSYKIEFGSTSLDTAYRVVPISSCNHLPEDENGDQIRTALPFKITNLTLDQDVLLWHYDKGIEEGYVEYGELLKGTCDDCDVNGEEICVMGGICLPRTGYNNCNWEYNEYFHFTDSVYTTNDPDGDDAKLFDFKLWFNEQKYMEYVGANLNDIQTPWSENSRYTLDQLVWHKGLFYKSEKTITQAQYPPDLWFDEDGDNINDNPWQVLYPWKEGDYIEIHPYKWFVDGDSWVMDLSVWGRETTLSSSDMDNISVVPNPYFIESDYNESKGEHRLHFTRLPNNCTLNIYTISGEFVHSIDHNDLFRGDEFWDLKNGQGQLVAPGLYIYVVAASGSEHIGKFAVIR